MGHLTYTRKRYNSGKAPEGLDGVDACERECVTGCYTPFLFIWSTALSIYIIILYFLPRAVLVLWNLLSFCVIAFWMSQLNAKHECIGWLLRCVDSRKKDRMNIRWKVCGNLISHRPLSVFLIVSRNESNIRQYSLEIFLFFLLHSFFIYSNKFCNFD